MSRIIAPIALFIALTTATVSWAAPQTNDFATKFFAQQAANAN